MDAAEQEAARAKKLTRLNASERVSEASLSAQGTASSRHCPCTKEDQRQAEDGRLMRPSWLDHHQSILEASQQGTKVPIQYKDQLNTVFTTIADHRVECLHNESAAHQVALAESYVFHVYEDTPIEVLNHMYHVNQQVGKNMISLPPCNWREKECASNHLMRDCPIYKALSGKEQLDHMMVSRRCLNCFKKGHRASQCNSHLRCLTCKLKHNSESIANCSILISLMTLLYHACIC
jgi:hypothetical protein